MSLQSKYIHRSLQGATCAAVDVTSASASRSSMWTDGYDVPRCRPWRSAAESFEALSFVLCRSWADYEALCRFRSWALGALQACWKTCPKGWNPGQMVIRARPCAGPAFFASYAGQSWKLVHFTCLSAKEGVTNQVAFFFCLSAYAREGTRNVCLVLPVHKFSHTFPKNMYQWIFWWDIIPIST